jgi:hypothetical protein
VKQSTWKRTRLRKLLEKLLKKKLPKLPLRPPSSRSFFNL